MARTPSKILTAAEIKVAKAEVKTEISGHANAVKTAEKAIKDAKKTLDTSNKTIEAVFAKAGKDHVAALKEASKQFDAVQKAQTKVIETSVTAGRKAEARAVSLTPVPVAAVVSNAGAALV